MTQVDPGSLLTLLEQHLSWYPLMEPPDIYKLLYQGMMGSEHLLTSQEQYTQSLYSEYEQLQPDASQRLLETVRPDGALFRLNLRPFKSRQLGLSVLTLPLLETAHHPFGTMADLSAVWAALVRLCQQGRISHYDPNLIHQFSHWLEAMNYPSVHHSELYRLTYQPAYRLISARFIPALGFSNAS
jgi:hypothetical protein